MNLKVNTFLDSKNSAFLRLEIGKWGPYNPGNPKVDTKCKWNNKIFETNFLKHFGMHYFAFLQLKLRYQNNKLEQESRHMQRNNSAMATFQN